MVYKKVLDLLERRPNPYEMGEPLFWDDPHISKFMLEAHLDPSLESASRQHSAIAASAAWIASLIESNEKASLLDLGCGPGIYAEEFDDLGFQVVGIDYSRRSVDYAQSHAQEAGRVIQYCYEDYLQAEFGSNFQCVTMVYCDIGVLCPDDRLIIMRKAHAALEQDGVFVFDCFSEHNYQDFKETRTIEYKDTGFWRNHPYACIKNDIVYPDTRDYLEQYLILDEEECVCYNLWNHAFTPQELKESVLHAGFSSVSLYGDIAGGSYDKQKNTIGIVARK